VAELFRDVVNLPAAATVVAVNPAQAGGPVSTEEPAVGIFLFPVMAFVLWEFPSMIAMSLHQLICALTGQSLRERFLGIWAYRLLGLFTFWPIAMVTAGTAVGAGAAAGAARVLLVVEGLFVIFLLAFAKTSHQGE
jgi:hypothetical protein